MTPHDMLGIALLVAVAIGGVLVGRASVPRPSRGELVDLIYRELGWGTEESLRAAEKLADLILETWR